MVAHRADMRRNSFEDESSRLFKSWRYDAKTGEIGNVGPIAIRRFFVNDGISHSFFNPACLSIALSVPLGISTLPIPATVTVPGLCGW